MMPKQDTQFKPGQSGNPNGRPAGAGRAAKLRALLEPDAPALIAKVKELALEGDTTALRMCLERLVPPLKAQDEAVSIDGMSGSLSEQGQHVIAAMSSGELTPSDAAALLQALAAQARIVEFDDLERRLRALEEKQHG